MKKTALIAIQGMQCYEGDEPQVLELMTNGLYEKLDDRCRIFYEETEMTGMEGVRTTFEVFPDRVELNREGGRSSPRWCSGRGSAWNLCMTWALARC